MRRKLSSEHQAFIVQCFARFMSPSEVVEAVKIEFGFEVSRQMVRHYHPNRGEKIAPEWIELFEKSRAEAISDIQGIGIAHLSYRLRQLQEMMIEARKVGNLALAAQLLEQAAKDCGGLFTNKRKIKISDRRKVLAELLGLKPEQLPPPHLRAVS